ncbi:unnamed protein product [Ectocarpus sp. 12 AP-2014]
MASMVVIPKMLLSSLKVKLGIVPDLDAALETTANTSLDFHAVVSLRYVREVFHTPSASCVTG